MGFNAWKNSTRKLSNSSTLLCFFVLAGCVLYSGLSSAAQELDIEREYQLKVDFMLKFSKFIRWPAGSFADDEQTLKVCMMGEDAFGFALSTIEGRFAGTREIELYHLDNMKQAPECNMLYVSRSVSHRLKSLADLFADSAVLTVSDIEGFADLGGIIEFVTKDDKISFYINLKKARENGFEIEASLLNLAAEVIQ